MLDADQIKNCTFTAVGMLNGIVITSATVFVEIQDINDPPMFMQQSYEGSIVEGLMVNSKVLERNGSPLVVAAVDQDDGENGNIKYKFVEDFIHAYFTLDELTGAIVTNYVRH